ncbi:MAG: hypothetical protein IPP61_01330 [Cytophagaceae bacterium]|nr:hypothetical protein [Cytophagaceae bacterium]
MLLKMNKYSTNSTINYNLLFGQTKRNNFVYFRYYTYLWTVPAGATFTNLTSRVLQVAGVTEAYAGEYTCKVTFGSCAIDVKTSLDISACENLYIKSYNPVTNIETNKLTRKPGTKDTYEPLVLEVQTLDGKVIKTMDYTWTQFKPGGRPDVTKSTVLPPKNGSLPGDSQ